MSRIFQYRSLGYLALLVGVVPAHAQVEFFESEADWLNAVQGVEYFDTTAENVGLANELLFTPASGTNLGSTLTYERISTGLSRSFTLKAHNPDYPYFVHYGPGTGNGWDDTLSVGPSSGWDEDAWELSVASGAPLTAFGVTIADNAFNKNDDSILIYGGTELLGSYAIPTPGDFKDGFFGFVSSTPVTRIVVDEYHDGDEAGFANLRFGMGQTSSLFIWTGAAGDDGWYNANNWSPTSGPPGEGDRVSINVGLVKHNTAATTSISEVRIASSDWFWFNRGSLQVSDGALVAELVEAGVSGIGSIVIGDTGTLRADVMRVGISESATLAIQDAALVRTRVLDLGRHGADNAGPDFDKPVLHALSGTLNADVLTSTGDIRLDGTKVWVHDSLTAPRVHQSAGEVHIKGLAEVGEYNLGGGSVVVYSGGSLVADELAIHGGHVNIEHGSTLATRSDASADLSQYITDSKILRNGTNLGLMATYVGGQTHVVYAPELAASIPSSTGFTPLNERHQAIVSGENAVIMVHGFGAKESQWDEMADKITTSLSGDPNNASTWTVATYDWSTHADEGIWGTEYPPPSQQTKAYAFVHGGHLAQQILAEGYQGHVHLIAHSLGGRVIDTASEVLRKEGWNGTIHLTFLDAYTPDEWEDGFGEHADWADHYFHWPELDLSPIPGDISESVDLEVLMNTGATIASATNVDLSLLDPITIHGSDLLPKVIEKLVKSHGVPVQWYLESITGAAAGTPHENVPYGFGMSLEAGYTGWTNGMPSVGGVPAVLLAGTEQPPVPGARIQALTQNTQSHENQFQILNRSSTGTVYANVDVLELTTDSPVWVNVALDLDEVSNAVSFDFQFTTNAEGLLTVYLDGEPISLFFEEFLPGDTWISTDWLTTELTLAPGMHSLGFRLDSLDGAISTIQIRGITTSLMTTVVPEPASGVGFVIVCLIFTHRRRPGHLHHPVRKPGRVRRPRPRLPPRSAGRKQPGFHRHQQSTGAGANRAGTRYGTRAVLAWRRGWMADTSCSLSPPGAIADMFPHSILIHWNTKNEIQPIPAGHHHVNRSLDPARRACRRIPHQARHADPGLHLRAAERPTGAW